ncbi:MAG TPA: DinB family protein [Gemmataceae bacterium]|jgi:hypothetical protein
MDQTIKHWVGLWDYLDDNFWNFWQWAAITLRPDEVGWQPLPQVASIGWNLQHLGEMLDHYLAHVFAQTEPVQRTPLGTMRSGSLDDGCHRDLQAIAAYHRQLRPAYRMFLCRLTAADLDRALAGGRARTWGWAVGHVAEHESYHLGKCMLLRKLLPARSPR